MPLTTTKTWQFDVNNIVTGATSIATQSALWLALKNALIGFASNPWEMSYSCDGVAAGSAGDAVDRWVDAGDVVFATSAGSAHSWCVLVNVITGMELLIECITTATTTGKVIRLVVSAAAGFTGGSTTSSPTATDQRVILDGTSQNTIGLGTSTTTTAPDLVLHVLHSSDGEASVVALDQANECVALAYFGLADQPVSGWTDPLVAAWYATSASVTPPTPATLSWAAVWATYSGGGGSSVPRCYGLNLPAGAAGAELHLVGPAISATNNSSALGVLVGETADSHTPAANDITGEHEAPAIGLFCATAGSRGTHGRLFDVRWAGDELSTGDTVPADGSRTWCKHGPWLLPWDGSVPQVA